MTWVDIDPLAAAAGSPLSAAVAAGMVASMCRRVVVFMAPHPAPSGSTKSSMTLAGRAEHALEATLSGAALEAYRDAGYEDTAPRRASCSTNTLPRTALSSSRTPAGLAPRASCRKRSTAPIALVRAASGSRSAIPLASCSGSGARRGIGDQERGLRLAKVTFRIVGGPTTAPALTPVNNEAVDATHPDFDGSTRPNL
jgi:hypothetical protein